MRILIASDKFKGALPADQVPGYAEYMLTMQYLNSPICNTPSHLYACFLDVLQVVHHIAVGLLRLYPNAIIDQCPIADGGEGTTAAVTTALAGQVNLTLHPMQCNPLFLCI